MAALDLLGRRWTLRLLWELRGGPLGPRTILSMCDGLSSSVLYRRIRDLEEAGLIQRQTDGTYAMTSLGRELSDAMSPLSQWSQKWAQHLASTPPASAPAPNE
jgi:DNA-binding HxlR family transcriptional regulator